MSVLNRYGGLTVELRRAAAAFLAVALLGFAACMALPELRQALMELLLLAVDSKAIEMENHPVMAMQLLSNNLRACGVSMLYGFIPFLQLAALPLGLNALMLGVLAAWYLAEGLSPVLYAAALLPHGVFELPALLLSLAVGLYICGQLTRRCRGDGEALPLWGCVTLAGQTLLALLPLLAAAAFVETYITPLAISLLS